MDFCGMNPALVPDGSNAYLFGNSLIIVTRWSDMTDEEKEAVEKVKKCMMCGKCMLVCSRGINTRNILLSITRIYNAQNI